MTRIFHHRFGVVLVMQAVERKRVDALGKSLMQQPKRALVPPPHASKQVWNLGVVHGRHDGFEIELQKKRIGFKANL